ncbi:hypothetical protein, partial [Staphylococcus aureus]
MAGKALRFLSGSIDIGPGMDPRSAAGLNGAGGIAFSFDGVDLSPGDPAGLPGIIGFDRADA